MDQPFSKTGYFDLQALAAFSCCSVRWLRDRLADRTHPLPYHRVEGKLLVKKEDFDQWITQYRQNRPDELDAVVNGVVDQVVRMSTLTGQ